MTSIFFARWARAWGAGTGAWIVTVLPVLMGFWAARLIVSTIWPEVGVSAVFFGDFAGVDDLWGSGIVTDKKPQWKSKMVIKSHCLKTYVNETGITWSNWDNSIELRAISRIQSGQTWNSPGSHIGHISETSSDIPSKISASWLTNEVEVFNTISKLEDLRQVLASDVSDLLEVGAVGFIVSVVAPVEQDKVVFAGSSELTVQGLKTFGGQIQGHTVEVQDCFLGPVELVVVYETGGVYQRVWADATWSRPNVEFQRDHISWINAARARWTSGGQTGWWIDYLANWWEDREIIYSPNPKRIDTIAPFIVPMLLLLDATNQNCWFSAGWLEFLYDLSILWHQQFPVFLFSIQC